MPITQFFVNDLDAKVKSTPPLLEIMHTLLTIRKKTYALKHVLDHDRLEHVQL